MQAQALLQAVPLAETLRQRRQRLARSIAFPVILWSGCPCSRNFPANTYPFRASSHFLYFAGLPLSNAAIRLMEGKLELFMDDETPASILWHGPSPTREQVAQQMGADAAFPLAELPARAGKAATIAVQDAATRQQQTQLLDRPIATLEPEGIDCQLAEVIVQLRLCHDSGAVAEMRQAAAVSVAAHQAGMAATATASIEAEVRAAMESVIAAHNMTCAYGSIVTIHGEVLHNDRYHHRCDRAICCWPMWVQRQPQVGRQTSPALGLCQAAFLPLSAIYMTWYWLPTMPVLLRYVPRLSIAIFTCWPVRRSLKDSSISAFCGVRLKI
jgi:hypothetical protein